MFDFGCLHVSTAAADRITDARRLAADRSLRIRFMLVSLHSPLVTSEVQSEAKKACDGAQRESVTVHVSSLASRVLIPDTSVSSLFQILLLKHADFKVYTLKTFHGFVYNHSVGFSGNDPALPGTISVSSYFSRDR
ncbi:uncharacterized protein V6R79_003139 [Siganus canaliculatus]